MQEITRAEFDNRDEPHKIIVTTNKYKYMFGTSNYAVVNDSIFGHGLLDKSEGNEFNWNWAVNYDGKIALSNVQSIKMEKSDNILTVIAIGISVAILVIAAINFDPLKEMKGKSLSGFTK
jgi:hypothetical protein